MWDRPGNRYLVQDLLADARGHNLVDTAFVECRASYRQEGPVEMRPVGETEFMEEIARRCLADPGCETHVAAAIVGHVDLRLGDRAASVLEAHLEASPERFRGIRHACAWHPSPALGQAYMGSPPGLLGDPEFRKGIACLDRAGLSYDSWAYMNQLGELTDLARTFPELTIVCDHTGGVIGIGPYAGRRDEAFAEWRKGMRELATCPNVFMKLGGLAMPLSGFGWQEREKPPTSLEMAEATAPYYLECIDAFGVERSMFESNFPVEKVSCSYRVLWNSFKRIAEDFSPDEKRWLFHDAAARAYGIGSAREDA
jgi:predicted TIM-barrel fold metal-dependent hydrolase